MSILREMEKNHFNSTGAQWLLVYWYSKTVKLRMPRTDRRIVSFLPCPSDAVGDL